MDRAVFKRLPPNVQTVLLETSRRLLDQLKEVTRNENQDAIKVMRKEGVKIVTPPKEKVDEFKRVSGEAMRRISGQAFSEKARDEVASRLENYRKGVK